ADYPAPNDRETPIVTPAVPRLEKTCRRALFLGRIHPKKGLDLLLRAWAKLGPMRDWQLVVAGLDEHGYATLLEDVVRSLGLAKQVVFTGPVVGAPKIALLYSADLFVLTSRSEGFPMAILEAMACARPIVATQASNFPEISLSQAGWECTTNL